MRQQGPGGTGLLFDPLMTALRKRSIAGKVMVALCLGRIDQFLARRVRPVEWNIFCCHCFDITGFAKGVEQEVRALAKLGVSIAGINHRSRRLLATKLFLCSGQLSTSFRSAGSPLTMPERFRC